MMPLVKIQCSEVMLLDSIMLSWKFVLLDKTFTQHLSFEEDLHKADVSLICSVFITRNEEIFFFTFSTKAA